MPFILPAGDYEAALRMAGASNFMEAFESGIDRNLRRRAQREGMRQQRELFEQGQATRFGRGMKEEELGSWSDGDEEALVAQIQQAGATEAALADVVTAASTQAAGPAPSSISYGDESGVVSVDDVDRQGLSYGPGSGVVSVEDAIRQGIAYGPGSGVVSMRDVPRRGVSYGAGSGLVSIEDALRNQIAYGPGTGVASISEDRFRLPPSRGGVVSIEDAPAQVEPRALDPRQSAFVPGTSQAQVEPRALDSVYGSVAPPLLGPKTSPGYRPPGRQYTQQELALGTPRPGVAYGPARPVGVVTPDPDPVITEIWRAPNVVDVGSLPPEEFALATPRGESQREVQLREAVRLISEGRAVDAQELLGASGKAYPSLGVETAAEGPTIPPEGDAVSDAARAAGTIGASFPGGGGSSAIQAALSAMAGAPLEEPAPTSLQRMADRAKEFESPEFGTPRAMVDEAVQEAVSPLDAAIATGAEESEEVSLRQAPLPEEPDRTPVEVTDEKTGKVHTVKPGEFVYGIAKLYNVSPQALIKANQSLFIGKDGKVRSLKTGGGKTLSGADLIFPGEKIRIPTGAGRETGGPAGPVDKREGVGEGPLAKADKEATSEAGARVILEKVQAKTPDKLINPFQAFGNPIDYAPELSSVASAVYMAERGYWSDLNFLAGTTVKNSELPGFLARYRHFVRGAKRKSREIDLTKKLAEETKANAAKQRAANAYTSLALKEIHRSGVTGEDAQVVAGHFGDLYSSGDTAAANMFLKNIFSTTAAKTKAAAAVEAARVKNIRRGDRRTGVVAPDGRGDAKQIKAAVSELDKLVDNRNNALSQLVKISPLSEGIIPTPEDLAKMESNPTYGKAARAYREANEAVLYGNDRLKVLRFGRPPPPPPFSLGDKTPIEFAEGNKSIQAGLASVRSGNITWDNFEKTISAKTSPEVSAAIVKHYRDSVEATPQAPPVKTLRSEQGIAAEAKLVSARKPLSASAAKQQSRRSAELKEEAREASKISRNRELLARFNEVTSRAEDLLIQRNAGERLGASDSEAVVSDLKDLLSDLSEKRQLEGGQLRGEAAYGAGIPSELRRGVSTGEDIRNLQFFISQLGG